LGVCDETHDTFQFRLPILPLLGGTEAAAAGVLTEGTAGLGALRADYLRQVQSLYQDAKAALNAGRSAEEVAREFVPLRNALKLAIRARGPWWAAAAAALRNLVKYGNTAGPTAEDLFKQYGSWEKVIDTIGSTSELVNKATGN